MKTANMSVTSIRNGSISFAVCALLLNVKKGIFQFSHSYKGQTIIILSILDFINSAHLCWWTFYHFLTIRRKQRFDAKQRLIHFRSHRYPFTVSIKTILKHVPSTLTWIISIKPTPSTILSIRNFVIVNTCMQIKKRRMLENSSSYNLCCGEFSVRSEEAWRESNLGKLYFTA